MITVNYLIFINENIETKTVLDSLINNLNKINKPKKANKNKVLYNVSVGYTADGKSIEDGGIYYTFFDSTTLQNGSRRKRIKVSMKFRQGYLTYVAVNNRANPTESNKIYGYLIVKDSKKINILKGIELIPSHKKSLESTLKTEPQIKPVKRKPVKRKPVKTETQTQTQTQVQTEPVKTEIIKTEPVKTEIVKPSVQQNKNVPL